MAMLNLFGSKIDTLNGHSRLQLQVFINRIHRKIFRRGKNRQYTILVKFLYHQPFFKSKFLGDGLDINIFQLS